MRPPACSTRDGPKQALPGAGGHTWGRKMSSQNVTSQEAPFGVSSEKIECQCRDVLVPHRENVGDFQTRQAPPPNTSELT